MKVKSSCEWVVIHNYKKDENTKKSTTLYTNNKIKSKETLVYITKSYIDV